jgi:putative FmdB family regulatory protein
MPAYDYDCAACGRRFEVIHGVHAERPTSCPLCGSGPIRKAISAPAIHYKGSGWAKKERSATATAKGPGDPGSSSEAVTDSKKDGDTKKDGASKESGSKDSASTSDAVPSPTSAGPATPAD